MTRNSDFRPQSRSGGLIVERLPGELLVYDEERDEAHCLHAEAAAVFDLVDGSRTSAEIAALASEHLPKPVSEARVAEVLAELDARHLLEDDGTAGDGLSRRDLIHRGALTGAGVAGAALITSIAAPVPAAAQSPPGETAGCTSSTCGEAQRCPEHPDDESCVCAEATGGEIRCLEDAQETVTCSSDLECAATVGAGGPNCVTAHGQNVCVQACETSSDCDAGEVCLAKQDCFSENVCFPVCESSNGTARAQRSRRARSGRFRLTLTRP